MTVLIVYVRLVWIYSIMLMFSHDYIILNKISVLFHLKAAIGRSSTKLLFYVSGKLIKICLWKCSILLELQAEGSGHN